MKYLFGPVPSRRLGLSLGVDLVPHKTCNFNCIYCECGKTTCLTMSRDVYVPLQDVLSEIDTFLTDSPSLDYITFSGAGEPTLHINIGDVIHHIKTHHPQYAVAVLTNGSLLHDKEVRDALLRADLVIPSLDAATEEVYEKINRPHPSAKLESYIEGLVSFRHVFPGKIWLEVFVVPGLNTSPSEVTALKAAIDRINPDKVQLNTLDRPGTSRHVERARFDDLLMIAADLGLERTEILHDFHATHHMARRQDVETIILSTLSRRPCTSDDLTNLLGIDREEVYAYLKRLVDRGILLTERQERGIFYKKK